MLSELDESIRRLLVNQGGLDPAEVDIRFEIPDREWAATISKPTVNCYLYDIHENRQLRGTEWYSEHDGQRGTRRRAPWRIDIAYLITVWTKAVEDEHRLLWHVLSVLFRHPIIPTEALEGALVEADVEIPTSVGQPESTLRSPGEFWSALDNKLKPSLNYIVTLPLDPEAITVAPLVFTHDVRVQPDSFAVPPGTAYVSGRVRGKRRRAVSMARLLLVGTNHSTTTDREGRYDFGPLPMGRHAVAVALPGQPPRERELLVPSDSYDLDVSD